MVGSLFVQDINLHGGGNFSYTVINLHGGVIVPVGVLNLHEFEWH
jgi:hypothetical protein